MSQYREHSARPHLVWVYGESLTSKLDRATWIETSSELVQMGWRVTLVAAGTPDWQRVRRIDIISMPKPNIYLLRQAIFHIGLAGWLTPLWGDIDIILFHQMAAPWLLPLRLVRRFRGETRPLLVMDVRDMSLPGRGIKTRLRVLFERVMFRLADRLADGQTAITPRMAEMVGISQRRLWGLWPSGVNIERFTPAQAARCWPAEDEAIRLVYVGVLLPQRHLLELCRAAERANAAGMRFEVALIGDGPARAELEQFAIGTDGRIRVLPPVSHEQVPDCLAQAHVGVTAMFPPQQTISQAASPVKLFEYMAAGLPVLATRIVCHTDVAGDYTFTFWADDEREESILAALHQIWQARDTLPRMGRQAAQAAHAWSWQAAAYKLKIALEHGLTGLPARQEGQRYAV